MPDLVVAVHSSSSSNSNLQFSQSLYNQPQCILSENKYQLSGMLSSKVLVLVMQTPSSKLLNLKKNLFILFIFFLAVLGLCCYAWAFSSCGERELLFIVVCGLPIVVASLVAEHGL